ncbi:MAG TPA: HNH endonuclease signature motif containing protein [Pyrinomonadaceae bacterium]|jgi:5-methylcytosine-specific restriction endonuclease McrA|nr:HNH endonuclease signature motif containing protein [Pyrinomonadaceae bacterium]
MSQIPRYLIIEDERAAYLARYHGVVPEGDELRRIVVRAYGGRCACCGFDSYQDMTIDHIEPIAVKGGTRKRYIALWRADFPSENLQLMCAACNGAKGAGRECPHTDIARHAAFYLLLLLQGNYLLAGRG